MTEPIGQNSGEQRLNMWEELNKPRAPRDTPPPPAASQVPLGEPLADEPPVNGDDVIDGESTAAVAMKRLDSQHLLLVGGVMFLVVAFVALKGLGGSGDPSVEADQAAAAITSPERLPAIDEPTTVPSTAAPAPTAAPTAMGSPAALLDGPQSAVYRLYRTALGREPDRAGFQFWSDEIRAGAPLERLAEEFLASPEFREQFSARWSADERAELLLTNAFGPAADEVELEAWLERYRGLSGAELLLAISEADETLAITGTLR